MDHQERFIAFMACVAAAFWLGPANGDSSNQYWDTQFGFGGTEDGEVWAVEVVGADIYVGGNFTNVSGLMDARGVARWDGLAWHSLGAGLAGIVHSIAPDESLVYFAGGFSSLEDEDISNVAAWDGDSWSSMGGGVPDAIYLLAVEVFDGDVYVGGVGWSGPLFSRWDGNAWSDLSGFLVAGDEVYALASDGSYLYVGGRFLVVAGERSGESVARWDGTTLAPLADGFPDGWIYSLAADSEHVYAGGHIYPYGEPRQAVLSEWSGTEWITVGGGVSSTSGDSWVRDLDLRDGLLSVVGKFDSAGGGTANQLAAWDGVDWIRNSGAAADPSNEALCVAKWVDGFYVGAATTNMGGVDASGVARWDGSWHRVSENAGNGMNTYVYALARDAAGNIVAGGKFTRAGGVAASRLAVFDGSTWSDLGGGVDGSAVYAILVDGTTIYVGGAFAGVGGAPAQNVAAWNGTTWDNVGGGVSGDVRALAVFDDDLVTGMYCSPCSLGHVARWDGAAWDEMATVSGSAVEALCVYNEDLYVGGSFTAIDGVGALNVAVWKAEYWAPVGDGFDGDVYALASFGNELYAGGSFGNSGAARALGIAKWDGTAWTEVGGGVWDVTLVRSLSAVGATLYVGGNFIRVNESLDVAYGVAGWRGGEWILPPGGPWNQGWHPGVHAVSASANDAYVGGTLVKVGQSPVHSPYSRYIGRWVYEPPVAVSTTSPGHLALHLSRPNPFNAVTQLRFTLSADGPVTLRIYDVRGKLVRTLIDRGMNAGTHGEIWDGRDDKGISVASGVYLVHLKQGASEATRKVVLLK